MKESEIISWIFLAISMAAQIEPASLKDISTIADGINHAVPTEKEIRLSISWLLTNEQIEKVGSKYRLTKKGLIHYNSASLKTNTLLEVWKNMERQIKYTSS
jgi:hypothetical protein